jgi:hypothetical protein
MLCSGTCTNTHSDDSNCGTCGHACDVAAGAFCSLGVCKSCVPVRCGTGNCGCGGMCCGSGSTARCC